MFRRTRRRIIFSIMGSLSLLFIITLSVILFASSRQMLKENLEKLESYSERFLLESQKNDMNAPGSGNRIPPEPKMEESPSSEPGSEDRMPPELFPDGMIPPRPMNEGRSFEDSPDYRLSVFYSVAFSKDNKVLEVENGDNDLYGEEASVP